MYTGERTLNVFEYSQYRKFLGDFYRTRKEAGLPISFRIFAKAAGFQSPSFLKMVIEGKRNLSHESIRKCVEALSLSAQEARFFTNLVLLNQADALEEKKYYAEQLLRSRPYQRLNPLKLAQYDYYTRWYFVAVRELVGTREFREDPAWVASVLEPEISPSEAKFALDSLLKLKLVERDAQGRLAQASQSLSTGDEVSASAVTLFHKEMIKKGGEALERFEASERDISAMTFGAGPETAKLVKDLVRRFRKELAETLMKSAEPGTDVYQLSFQLFPLSRTGKKARAG